MINFISRSRDSLRVKRDQLYTQITINDNSHDKFLYNTREKLFNAYLTENKEHIKIYEDDILKITKSAEKKRKYQKLKKNYYF